MLCAMATLVVYESMFGATRAVAEAVAAGLESARPVRLVEVTEFVDAPGRGALPPDLTLLVLGGPTHAFGMSRPATRADAEKRYGPVLSKIGVREFLEHAELPAGLLVGAFGTKLSSPLSGSAARGIAQRLRKLGGRLAMPPQDFFVPGSSGVEEAQLEAARVWGERLATAASLLLD